jgi:hypothetical protein
LSITGAAHRLWRDGTNRIAVHRFAPATKNRLILTEQADST